MTGINNGLFPFTRVSTPDNNQTIVSQRPCQLVVVSAGNINAAARYVKFFDTATAGTSAAGFTPQVPIWQMIIPGNTAGAGSNIHLNSGLAAPGGLQFNQGMGIMITANSPLADNSGISVSEVILSLAYR